MDLTPLVLVLVLGFVFLGWRTFRRSAEPVHPAPPEQQHHPYHCVVVEARDGACEAARKLADMRFLVVGAEAGGFELQAVGVGAAAGGP